MKRLLSLVSLVTFASVVGGAVQAQAPDAQTCRALTTAIEDGEKDMSMTNVSSVIETSAVRQAVSEQQTGNSLQLIALNLALATQAHCQPRKDPIRATAYLTSASECLRVGADVQLAAARAGTASPTQLPPECNRANWKRDAQGPGETR